MNHEEIKQLLIFDQWEKVYREFFLANPEAYDEPIADWNSFVLKYSLTSKQNKTIPETSPSIMGQELLEKDWFSSYESEVSVVKNARYCPPFLHSLEFIKLIFVMQGKCTLFIGGEKIEMLEGGFCIIAPGIEQTIFSSDDNDVIINIIMRKSTFSSSFSSLLVEQSDISDFFWQMLFSKSGNKIMLFQSKADNDLKGIIFDLIREANYKDASSNMLMKSYVILFFGYVLRNHQKDLISLGIRSKSQSNLPHIIQYIRKNASTLTLASLAQHFHKSEGYMSRYIKRETGQTFRCFLRELRMKQAAEMLKNSKCSIEEIAYAIGYSETGRFYRNFKEMFGVTPAVYRKQAHKMHGL